MKHLYLSRRNLLTLLSKLDAVRAGEKSACTLIKHDTLHEQFACSEVTVVTGIEEDTAITAVEDCDYYSDRQPGEVKNFNLAT